MPPEQLDIPLIQPDDISPSNYEIYDRLTQVYVELRNLKHLLEEMIIALADDHK